MDAPSGKSPVPPTPNTAPGLAAPPAQPAPVQRHLAWQDTTRLVFGLAIVVLIGGLLARFSEVVTSIILSLILAYVMFPATSWLHRRARLPWALAVLAAFGLLALLALSLAVLAGISVTGQVAEVVSQIEQAVADAPELIATLPTRIEVLGYGIDIAPWMADPETLQAIGERGAVVLTRTVGVVASATVNVITTGLLTFVVALFILVDLGPSPGQVIRGLTVPGYEEDIRRLRAQLQRIWATYLRTQVIFFMATIVLYLVALKLLRLDHAVALAALAGLARFVPYLGPALLWVVMVIVALLQGGALGLSTGAYALLVFLVAFAIDSLFDYVITPRVAGKAMGVPSAALLIAVTVLGSLFGIVGLLLAAPLLATAMLFLRYAFFMLTNQDPWPESVLEAALPVEASPEPAPGPPGEM